MVFLRVRLCLTSESVQGSALTFQSVDDIHGCTCPLCGKGIENRKHFILLCPVTETARIKFKQKIIDRMNSSIVTHLDVQNDDILLQIIVDCSTLLVGSQYSDLRHELETLSRELIYNVHILHTRLMTSMHMPGWTLFFIFNLIKLDFLNPEVGCTYTDWWNIHTITTTWPPQAFLVSGWLISINLFLWHHMAKWIETW